MTYAQIILPITNKNVDKTFTYSIPASLQGQLNIGDAVDVPFGRGNKLYTAYIVGFTNECEYKTKDIIGISQATQVTGETSFLSKEMIALSIWMKEKYYTTLAQCIGVIIPTGLTKLKRKRKKLSPKTDNTPTTKKILNDAQQKVLDTCLKYYQDKAKPAKPILIHGVTGSGKTEVYMEIIAHTIAEGKQAIVLVPEISLTPQTVARFESRFGNLVSFTHSKLSQGERVDQWQSAKNGDISIIIGPRSAVFAPFPNLGAIIIDEEHEHTYKSETTPKYDAKEVAIKRASLTNAIVVLGSATPSISTFYKAEQGEYTYLTLTERVNNTPPSIEVIDMRAELREGNTSIFSTSLGIAIDENLKQGLQTILFLNRRGHSTFVSCRNCGHVMACDNCNVNYTYHRFVNKLICHYCTAEEENPNNCPTCGSKFIRHFGIGTQRIEKDIQESFPDARILRMDLDTTSKKHSHEDILSQFREHKADILIGTQMIAKGLDFPKVTVVGIIAADTSLNAGDYRSGENTFQLLTQVAGRAGRADHKGKVYIQTYAPEHYAITYTANADYQGFYKQEISLRRQMSYQPFSNLFVVLFSGINEKEIITALFKLSDIMNYYAKKRPIFEILGPAPAVISKISNKYRWKLIIKCENEEKLKNFVLYTVTKLEKEISTKNINISLTMNPNTVQ